MNETLHIYTRVSSATQEEDGTSLETQRELGIKCAEKNGFKFKIWNEGAQSSAKDDLTNRPVLTQLLDEITNHNVQHLYVWNTDRLSRNLQTWGMIRLKLIQNAVTLHTPTGEQILSDPQTNMFLGILSEISQYDNAIRTERFRLGKLHKIKQGFWKGGPPPFGYELVDGKLSPHPTEKDAVREIYQLYANKQSIRNIRNHLQKKGVLTRRGKSNWGDRTLEIILDQDKTGKYYGGNWTFTDKKTEEIFHLKCPKILDDALLHKVKIEFKTRSRNNRVSNSNEKYFYLLKGLLKCKCCGLVFSARKSDKQQVYYCPSKERNFRRSEERKIVCTNNKYLKIDKTDKLVWDTIIDTLSKSHLYKESFKSDVLHTSENYQKQSDRLKILRRKKKKFETELSDVSDSIVSLETDKILKKRSPDEIDKIISNLEQHQLSLRTEMQTIQSAIEGISQSRKWVNWVNKFASKLEDLNELSDIDKKKFLTNLVSDVSVETLDLQTHRLHIKFVTPIVDDNLIWKNPMDKKLGYELIDGKLLRSVDFDVGKTSRVGT